MKDDQAKEQLRLDINEQKDQVQGYIIVIIKLIHLKHTASLILNSNKSESSNQKEWSLISINYSLKYFIFNLETKGNVLFLVNS